MHNMPFQSRVQQPHMGRMCRCVARKKRAAERKAGSAKATPKAMTPSTAYPYYDAKPMQFRGVKVRAEPPVQSCNSLPEVSQEKQLPKITWATQDHLQGPPAMEGTCIGVAVTHKAMVPCHIVNTAHTF